MLQGRFGLVFVNTFTDFSGYTGEEMPTRNSNFIPTFDPNNNAPIGNEDSRA